MALVIAFATATALYISIQYVVIHVVPHAAATSTPAGDVAKRLVGPLGATLVTAAILVSIYGYLSATFSFDVRHSVRGKELLTRVTVLTDSRDSTLFSMQQLIATYYKTSDIKKASGVAPERQVQFTARELHQLATSASALNERMKDRVT